MTHTSVEAQKSSGGLMEDVINIFVNPVSAFEHQRTKSFVMPALIQSLLFAVLVFALRNLTAPFVDAEMSRQMALSTAAAAAKGQPMPEGATAMAEKFAGISAIVGPIIVPWLSAIFGGLFVWLGARIVGAKMGYGQSATVAAWSAFPGVLAYIAMGVLGMVMDPANIRGVGDGQLGLARFVDPATTGAPLMAFLQNIDIFGLWTILLTAIGISIVGRVSFGSGMAGAFIRWGVVLLFTLGPALLRG